MLVAESLLCIIFGVTLGAFGAALFYYKDGNIKRIAKLLKDYCVEHSCEECKFHSNDYPYCNVRNYPLGWNVDDEER